MFLIVSGNEIEYMSIRKLFFSLILGVRRPVRTIRTDCLKRDILTILQFLRFDSRVVAMTTERLVFVLFSEDYELLVFRKPV